MTQTIVYFVDSAVFGGSEQVLLHLLTHLDRARWHPVLFHHPEKGLESFLKRARELDVKIRTVPRMQGPAAIPSFYPFLYNLRGEQPTIFHAHLSWLLSCKFGLLAAAMARIPAVIATLHQFLTPPWKPNIYWQQRLVTSNVHLYTAVSQAVAQQLSQSFQVPSCKIRVIYNGVPVASHGDTTVQGPHKGSKRPIVLTVARLDAQKGHKFLLEAIPQIPDAHFLLAGSGTEQEGLEARARDLGISTRISFLGYRSDIPTLLASCDVFVLPSLYEGFPLSILEAMAAGRPVVATAVGGTPEAIIDGVTGYLVPPGDSNSLAGAICNVLSNPKLAHAMGWAGRERVQASFSVDVMADRYGQIYEELVNAAKVNETVAR